MPEAPSPRTRLSRRARTALAVGASTGLTAALILTVGAMANAATLTSDDFNDGNAGGWSTNGGSWSAGSGVYTQSGTGAAAKALTGSTSWATTTVTARVRPDTFGGSTSRGIGVAARVQSSSNFYALVVTPTAVQIRKGASTTLASAAFSASPGTWYTLSLSATGSSLVGSVNGAQLVSTSDGSYATGRIGLVANYTAGAFDDVLVTDAAGPGPTSGPTSRPPSSAPPSTGPSPSTGPTPPPPTGILGWATQGGGTTGGKGGATVNVSSGSALIQALADASGPTTIMVSGTITPANSGGAEKIDVKDVQDVSIIGAGEGAELNGIGIKIVRASNIVIRNLRIHHVATGDKDAISIEGPADHIWIDHNELYADYQTVDKDFYDGLLDVKSDAEYITYSWNYLHDSWKTSLVGSSEDDTFDRKLTMHHNYFRNCNSRLPLFRGGNGHVFNNYYEDIVDTGINARIGACLRIEANYFQDARNPWVSAYSDELGGGELTCNVLAGTSPFEYADDVHELETCTANVPYDYDAVLNHPDEVPAVVMDNAGVGKLDDPTDF